MIFRNSILSIFRSKRKTALFILLIFALTIVLTRDVSVWASNEQLLGDCDEFFTTVGLVEYMGAGFLICYLLGSAISVTIMNHSNVLTILTDKD